MSFKDFFVVLLVLAYVGVFRKPGDFTWLSDLLMALAVILTIVKIVWLEKKEREEQKGK